MPNLVGDIELGDDASIWPMVAARGDINHIRIGCPQQHSRRHRAAPDPQECQQPNRLSALIGRDVTVGHKGDAARLHHRRPGAGGMGAILLDGVIVEDDVMIRRAAWCRQARLEAGFSL